MTIHVANTIAEFLKEIRKGFNKVRWLELRNETQTEPYEGEQTQEEFEEHIKNYAVFIAHADLYGDDFGGNDDDNDYVTTEFGWGEFERDFTKALQDRLGDDVQITFRSGCNEFECIRVPGYSYKKTQEKPVKLINGCTYDQIRKACVDLQIKHDDGFWADGTPESILEILKVKGWTPDASPIQIVEGFIKDCAVQMIAKKVAFFN